MPRGRERVVCPNLVIPEKYLGNACLGWFSLPICFKLWQSVAVFRKAGILYPTRRLPVIRNGAEDDEERQDRDEEGQDRDEAGQDRDETGQDRDEEGR